VDGRGGDVVRRVRAHPVAPARRVLRHPRAVASELPFIVGYWLVASTAFALADGDLGSPGGAAGAVVALPALAGLVVIVRRALRAPAALPGPGRPHWPWGRILRAPFHPGRLGVIRVRGLAYGDGPRRTLDVYHRRGRPACVPVLVHFHGGGFHSGDKRREARPLIRHLTGANLAIRAAGEDATGIAGLICRYGYYGDLTPRGDMPPMLIVHGQNDMMAPAADARAFAKRARAVSSRPVSYAELPGAYHDFDLYESIRSAAVSHAVEQLTARSPRAGRPATAPPAR
jgi:hypothetical protein